MGSIVSVKGMVEKPATGRRAVQPGRDRALYPDAQGAAEPQQDQKSGAGGEIQLTDAIAQEIDGRPRRLWLPVPRSAVRLRLQGRVPAGDGGLWSGARRSAGRILGLPARDGLGSRKRRSSRLHDDDACSGDGWGRYIGSHACKALARCRAILPVTYDNLSTGWARCGEIRPVRTGRSGGPRATGRGVLPVPARRGDAFRRPQPGRRGDARDPGIYWRNNVVGLAEPDRGGGGGGLPGFRVLLDLRDLWRSGQRACWTRATPQDPINAYGASKRAIEDMLRDFEASHGLRLGDLPLFQRRRAPTRRARSANFTGPKRI